MSVFTVGWFQRWRTAAALVLLVSPAFLLGCNGDSSSDTKEAETATEAEGEESNEQSAPSRDIGDNDPNTLVAIGDSITAGTLVSVSYPSRLSGILGKNVVNAGVPGALSSSAGGQAQSAMGRNPAYLLIMFGTNDVFREIDPGTVAANVRAAVRVAKANSTIPVVATIPPNLRSEFQNGLVNSYNSRLRSMAASEGALLANVNGEFGSGSGLIQDDGFHPNDTGTQIIAFTFADAVR